MDFMTGLLVSTDWKSESYNSIFIIINRLTKIIYYKSVKIIIDVPSLADVIIDDVIKYYGLPNSIITDQSFLFMSKFSSLLCYYLRIEQRLFTTFYLQTNAQTEKQNSIIEVYLKVFVN